MPRWPTLAILRRVLWVALLRLVGAGGGGGGKVGQGVFKVPNLGGEWVFIVSSGDPVRPIRILRL
jgi:hypothetical protein